MSRVPLAPGVTVRPFQAADYAAVAALNNTNFPEFARSADELRLEDEHRPAHCQAARWVAQAADGEADAGRIVACAEYDQVAQTYHPRRFNLEVLVEPARQAGGIGGHLFGVVLAALRHVKPLSVELWTREDMWCRVAFLEHRGFVPDMRLVVSELDLGAFDPAPLEHAVRALEAGGIVIRSLAELRQTDAACEAKLYDLWCEIHADVPLPPGQAYQPRSFERWRERNFEHPGLLPEAYLVAVDQDQYVAMTQLWRTPSPERLGTGLTGVRRAYRRRGLALGLKVRALADAKAGGFASVGTENAATNAGMLRVNERLGFVRLPTWLHYVAAWDVLEARGYV